VPGLTIYCKDTDLLFPGFMLIELDKILQYSPEDPKQVLIEPGEGDLVIRKCTNWEFGSTP